MRFYVSQRDQQVLFEITRHVGRASKRKIEEALDISHSQVQSSVVRLEAKGLITSTRTVRIGDGRGRDAKIYNLTPKGRNQIKNVAQEILKLVELGGIEL
jgi:DNA-binding PadR family transcriptional regulator